MLCWKLPSKALTKKLIAFHEYFHNQTIEEWSIDSMPHGQFWLALLLANLRLMTINWKWKAIIYFVFITECHALRAVILAYIEWFSLHSTNISAKCFWAISRCFWPFSEMLLSKFCTLLWKFEIELIQSGFPKSNFKNFEIRGRLSLLVNKDWESQLALSFLSTGVLYSNAWKLELSFLSFVLIFWKILKCLQSYRN